MTELLGAHSQYRSRISGVDSLVWSSVLQINATQWARYLATNLLFKHSGIVEEGENLWMGAPSSSFTAMVQDWGAEIKRFKNGIFPNVSTSGSWKDVGHYTQIIWRNTVSVGCGGAVGIDGLFRLVCRYSPPGNYIGEKVY